MHVVVGPVSAESMGAFASFARDLLHGPGPGADVPSDAASAFDGYLDEWTSLAGEGGDVTWSAEADPEVVEYLVYSFFRVAKEVNLAASGDPVVLEPAAAFYWMLVDALLEALSDEGGSRSEFADHLREFWPRGEQLR